jgi:hypothetical protein
VTIGASPQKVFHLPGLDPDDSEDHSGWHEGVTAAGLRFRSPRLTVAGAARVADRVRAAALEARRERPLAQVVRALAVAAGRLVDSASDTEGGAVRTLADELGWPEPLARETLLEMGRIWTEESLWDVLRSELADPEVLDGFRPAGAGRQRRAAGHPLLLQVMAGNVPGVAVTGVMRALLCRSGVLVKLPEAEPGLVVLFARLLGEVDSALGSCVAAAWWPADREGPIWDEWTARAGTVVVYGGEEAVAGVRDRVRGHQQVLAYGPKLGVAVLLSGTEPGPAASALARDICAYEQMGCVSPRLVLVQDSVEPFAHALGAALAEETHRIPRPPLRADEAVAIRALRAEIEFRGYEDGSSRVIGRPEDLSWTVLIDDQAVLELDSLPRVVRLSGFESILELRETLRPLDGRIQAIGYAGDEDRFPSLAEAAVDLGVSRMAPLGRMAWPPADWRHDGSFQLLPLLDWTEWEGGETGSDARGRAD